MNFRNSIPFALLLSLAACSGDDDAAVVSTPAQCARSATEAVVECLGAMRTVISDCYAADGVICATDAPEMVAAMNDAEATVRADCTDDVVRGAGFGPQMTTDSLVRRIRTSCRTEAASLAVRSYGGPQGAALAEASADERSCLDAAHQIGTDLMMRTTTTRLDCVVGSAEDCLNAPVDPIQPAIIDIGAVCDDLAGLVAIDAPTFVERAVAQADCIAVTAHPDLATPEIACGPRDAIERAPRGEYMEVVLDSEVWGTRCGDGSPFAFQVRLAPEGSPVENLLVAMEGGGVCLFEDDCSGRPAELFEAMNDLAPTTGIMSNDPAESQFANWSKVYLPYCNQDVFIGGGATNVFDNGFTVHRFGAVNVRAAMRYVRDLIWRELDENTEEGYRPDLMRVFFGGFSAGAFGTLYNYHYVLDDLQWEHTTAFPDAGLALDSGAALSVGALGAILIPESDIGWSSLPYLPPYCFDFDCGVGPVGLEAVLPRLKAVPEQQILILTNQIDNVQIGTTFFANTADWVNELRFQYCEIKDRDGVKSYMPAIPESRHVISPFPDLYRGNTVDGVEMADWLWGAVTNPDDVVNRVEEGNLVEVFEGVEPFPCTVAP